MVGTIPQSGYRLREEYRDLGALAGGPLFELQAADRLSEPRLVQWDAWGRRVDRIEVQEYTATEPFLKARVERIPDVEPAITPELEALRLSESGREVMSIRNLTANPGRIRIRLTLHRIFRAACPLITGGHQFSGTNIPRRCIPGR